MVTQELIKKLKELEAKNLDRDKLIKMLLDLNYSKSDIEDAINLSSVKLEVLKKVDYEFVEAKGDPETAHKMVLEKPKGKLVYFFGMVILLSVAMVAIFFVIMVPFLGDKIEKKRVEQKLLEMNREVENGTK